MKIEDDRDVRAKDRQGARRTGHAWSERGLASPCGAAAAAMPALADEDRLDIVEQRDWRAPWPFGHRLVAGKKSRWRAVVAKPTHDHSIVAELDRLDAPPASLTLLVYDD
jgi:hypothetical protein